MSDPYEISDEFRAYFRSELPQRVDHGMALFEGIKIEQTRECLLAALHRLSDPETALEFRTLIHDIVVFWHRISPDDCLNPLWFKCSWLSSISLALNRRERRSHYSRNDFGAFTREVIEQHTPKMIDLAEKIPSCTINAHYLSKISDFTSPVDRALELKAALRREAQKYHDEFLFRPLGKRLQPILEHKITDEAEATRQVKEMEAIIEELIPLKEEGVRLGRKEWYVYELFTVIRSMAKTGDEACYLSTAKTLVAELRRTGHLPCGGRMNAIAKQKLALALLAASRLVGVRQLDLCPDDEELSAFLVTAVAVWAKGRSQFIND